MNSETATEGQHRERERAGKREREREREGDRQQGPLNASVAQIFDC